MLLSSRACLAKLGILSHLSKLKNIRVVSTTSALRRLQSESCLLVDIGVVFRARLHAFRPPTLFGLAPAGQLLMYIIEPWTHNTLNVRRVQADPRLPAIGSS